MRIWLLAVALVACGGETDGPGGGKTGSGGGGGTAGASSAGASSAGASSAGASSGGTSAGGAGSECTGAMQCTLFDDCCSCESLAPNEEGLPCPADCVEGVCDPFGTVDVACTRGRCTLNVSCDTSRVARRSLPPVCPTGQVSSVLDLCWGPCVFPEDCND